MHNFRTARRRRAKRVDGAAGRQVKLGFDSPAARRAPQDTGIVGREFISPAPMQFSRFPMFAALIFNFGGL